MKVEKIIAGSKDNTALILKKHVEKLNMDLSYARMMLHRVSGNVKDECIDTYYICHENNVLLSRLWNGWGNHKNAIGNFGNFLTIEEARGKGLGGKLLSMWFDDISKRDDLPLALFCSAGSKELVSLYSKYGFKLAVRNTKVGPLYKPLKNSPDTFFEFCKEYYSPSSKLTAKKATVQYRHEIDCLLKFALLDLGLNFGFEEASCLEEILMGVVDTKAEILFTDDNKVAGWRLLFSDGSIKTQVYPLYENLSVV